MVVADPSGGPAPAPNLEELRAEAEAYVSQIKDAIPLATAWWQGRARLRHKWLMPITAGGMVLAFAGFLFYPVYVDHARQEQLFRIMAVATAADGEGRDPLNAAYELQASLRHWKSNHEPDGLTSVFPLSLIADLMIGEEEPSEAEITSPDD